MNPEWICIDAANNRPWSKDGIRLGKRCRGSKSGGDKATRFNRSTVDRTIARYIDTEIIKWFLGSLQSVFRMNIRNETINKKEK